MGGAESRAVTKHSISAPSYADTLPPDFISGGGCWHQGYQPMILPPDFVAVVGIQVSEVIPGSQPWYLVVPPLAPS